MQQFFIFPSTTCVPKPGCTCATVGLPESGTASALYAAIPRTVSAPAIYARCVFVHANGSAYAAAAAAGVSANANADDTTAVATAATRIRIYSMTTVLIFFCKALWR